MTYVVLGPPGDNTIYVPFHWLRGKPGLSRTDADWWLQVPGFTKCRVVHVDDVEMVRTLEVL